MGGLRGGRCTELLFFMCVFCSVPTIPQQTFHKIRGHMFSFLVGSPKMPSNLVNFSPAGGCCTGWGEPRAKQWATGPQGKASYPHRVMAHLSQISFLFWGGSKNTFELCQFLPSLGEVLGRCMQDGAPRGPYNRHQTMKNSDMKNQGIDTLLPSSR